MNNALKLKSISVSEMDNNCYLICAGEEALLVDAADDAPALLNLAKENGVRISAVLTTHRHWDHVRATKEVIKATGATHYASFLDSPAMPAPVDVELKQGDTLTFAGHEFPAIILRGHTPGGVAIAVDIDGTTNLFVGDSLFPGGVGRTDSEGDFVRLYKDVNERIFDVYPDSAIVRPGHGKSTTLGEERPKLAEWWQRRW
ncbi:Zn-dependent hydrolase [Corynebacterium sp. HMSC06D04]|uniref:MBL fold metallo-hydrolase n=1 Tax=Corynebacterium accolens TaxID=38284 RepID=A0A2A4AL15_9CORY|nr:MULTISPECIES: MBL fold metallo-hydrolase [Corynebacterium]PCC82798.1 MBL fold metallo-hydrolase [Corynebacterium accolens]AMO90309.1 metallo-beta-lactamase superfamily protein [Corynebacterium simulans]AMO90454.1 metallo-beta-lactamase superfamily protein [Corynebacterium simulans]OFQ49426.1 Zn-dependent hydrolase [Corynebacterium sp. HMSC076D02]OFR38426.1 Zn-dependent hydrolase [Corynebacterium sp. HMSC077D03]